jgi:hypothetical protein
VVCSGASYVLVGGATVHHSRCANPTGFVARVPLRWRWSWAPGIYSPSLGLVPRGVEAGRWQIITGVRGALPLCCVQLPTAA